MCLPVGTMAWIHTFTHGCLYAYSFDHEESTCLAYISGTATSSTQYIRSELCLRSTKGKVQSPQYFANHEALKKYA